MRIAVEGCCHGELDRIYASLQLLENKQGKKIDLLICCGDFQAVRNLDDLETMSCPPKYRNLGTFYKYYTGQVKAPYPTLFIGGNHEATNYLWELYYGGWVAPNIYYMGHAGVVKFGGVRIAGVSGIFAPHDYRKGHHEREPYTYSAVKSAYHVRELEVFRMLQVRDPIDIALSHDWPQHIAYHGFTQQLFRAKPHLRADIESGELGSPPAMQLVRHLRPRYWFSAHHHIKFGALVEHEKGDPTRFLALDKCLPGRSFLQVVDIPEAQGLLEFCYDEEWLAILCATHSLLSLSPRANPLPGMGGARDLASSEKREKVLAALAAAGADRIPSNFECTAPGHGEPGAPLQGRMPTQRRRNPQTEKLLSILGLTYNLDPPDPGLPPPPAVAATPNPEEISLDDDDL